MSNYCRVKLIGAVALTRVSLTRATLEGGEDAGLDYSLNDDLCRAVSCPDAGERVRELLAKGADPNCKGFPANVEWGTRASPALKLALEGGCEATFQLLVKAGANMDCIDWGLALNTFIPNCGEESDLHVRRFKILLKYQQGKDEINQVCERPGQTPSTPLISAVAHGQAKFVLMLLQAGANIELKAWHDKGNEHALQHAKRKYSILEQDKTKIQGGKDSFFLGAQKLERLNREFIKNDRELAYMEEVVTILRTEKIWGPGIFQKK